MERTYRVSVKGRFANLDENDRARLLAEVPALPSGFTEQGTMHYERSLDFFTLRYVIRARNELPDDSDVEAALIAEEKAIVSLAEMGVAHRNLEVFGVTCLDDMRIRDRASRRRRREGKVRQ